MTHLVRVIGRSDASRGLCGAAENGPVATGVAPANANANANAIANTEAQP